MPEISTGHHNKPSSEGFLLAKYWRIHMATPKKKHLIELMIEADVKWPDGAKYAAQDKDTMRVRFYRIGKPFHDFGVDYWNSFCGSLINGVMVKLPELCSNWHQTIVTREQYVEARAAAGNVSEPAVDEVEWHNPPSIEQLTANYHAKTAEADRLQSVADEALKAADDALLALEKAGELIGLVISIDTKPKHVEPPVEPVQPVITDWRDLRVGDVVEYVRGTIRRHDGKQGYVCEIDESDNRNRVRVMFGEDDRSWCSKWRFIRRP